jgi:hypothetical protein
MAARATRFVYQEGFEMDLSGVNIHFKEAYPNRRVLGHPTCLVSYTCRVMDCGTQIKRRYTVSRRGNKCKCLGATMASVWHMINTINLPL